MTYQDRLGTNVKKAQQKGGVSRQNVPAGRLGGDDGAVRRRVAGLRQHAQRNDAHGCEQRRHDGGRARVQHRPASLAVCVARHAVYSAWRPWQLRLLRDLRCEAAAGAGKKPFFFSFSTEYPYVYPERVLENPAVRVCI